MGNAAFAPAVGTSVVVTRAATQHVESVVSVSTQGQSSQHLVTHLEDPIRYSGVIEHILAQPELSEPLEGLNPSSPYGF